MRKIVSALLAIIMVLSMLPMAAFAADGVAPRDPYAYLGIGGTGRQTIVSRDRLTDILTYEGTSRNMHIAAWLGCPPDTLDFPAYCYNPGIAGVAQHGDKQYQLAPKDALTDSDKVVLGIMRAGFPYKSYSELGLSSEEDAFYATQAAIWNYIQNGADASSLDKWQASKSDPEDNAKIKAALTAIYTEGIANPYSPPAIQFFVEPIDNGDGTASAQGDWIVTEYEVASDYPFTAYRLSSDNAEVINLIKSGVIKVTDPNGNPYALQQNVWGAWDESWTFRIPASSGFKVWMDKDVAESMGAISYNFIASISEVEMEYAVCYIGVPDISGSWQGYAYASVPRQSDGTVFLYSSDPVDPPPPGETTPSEGSGALTVQKLDAHTRQHVGGALFQIKGMTFGVNTYVNASIMASSGATIPFVAKGATVVVQDGVIKITGLPSGVYEITEVSQPTHYGAPEDQNSQSVQVFADAEVAAQVTFENRRYGELKIQKVDSQNPDTGLVGVHLRVQNLSTGFDVTVITQSDGLATVSDLEPGTYIITETVSRPDFLLDATPHSIAVNWNETATITITNDPKPSAELLKLDADTNSPVSQAHFEFKHKNTQETFIRATDSSGRILLDAITPGWWDVREISAEGYVIDTAVHPLFVEVGQSAQLTLTNQRIPTLILEKVDSQQTEKFLAGASYEVKIADGQALPGSPYTTGTDGKVVIGADDLRGLNFPLKLQITEIAAPSNYLIDDPSPHIITLEAGKDSVLRFTDTQKPSLRLLKSDSITSDPIPGTKFQVWRAVNDSLNGELIDLGVFYTDENGEILLTNQETGWHRIVELEPSSGYAIKGSDTQDVFLSPGEEKTVYFENVPLSAIVIRKTGMEGEPVPNTLFRVRFMGNVSGTSGTVIYEGRTSINGTIVLNGLSRGTYLIEELMPGSDDYELSGEAKTVFLSGEDQDVIIVEFVNLKKGTLALYKRDSVSNEPVANTTFSVTYSDGSVIGNNNGLFTTDESGLILIDEPLTVGATVVVREVNCPDTHILDETPQMVRIKAGRTHTLYFYNTPRGGLQIAKTDEANGKPIGNVKMLVEYLSGERIGTFTTNSSGIIYIPNIEGWVRVTEISAPGYVVESTPYEIEVKPGGIAKLSITNRRASGILLHKIDSISKKGIYNVSFLLYDSNKNPIGQYETDQDGFVFISIKEGIPSGKYFLRELRPAPGYLPDDTLRTIYLEAGKTTEIYWENTPEQGQIQVMKKSGDDNQINGLPAGSFLQGAVFEAYDYKTGNLLDRFVSGADGRAVSRPLPLGRIIVKEVQAPSFYSLSSQVLDLEIEYAGQIVKAEFLNYSANTGVAIRKIGNLEAMAGDVISYDIKEVRNTSTVPLTDFFWRDILPVDAVRLTKIVTGTYNQALQYKVMITTNKGDTRVISDNLSTTRNNVIDCSNAALGLKSDEYVTSFTLLFGTVRAGFCQVEQPKIYVQVLSNLPNGYVFANRADIGGKYGQEWIIGNTTWQTIIYTGKPGTLPRTGY